MIRATEVLQSLGWCIHGIMALLNLDTWHLYGMVVTDDGASVIDTLCLRLWQQFRKGGDRAGLVALPELAHAMNQCCCRLKPVTHDALVRAWGAYFPLPTTRDQSMHIAKERMLSHTYVDAKSKLHTAPCARCFGRLFGCSERRVRELRKLLRLSQEAGTAA